MKRLTQWCTALVATLLCTSAWAELPTPAFQVSFDDLTVGEIGSTDLGTSKGLSFTGGGTPTYTVASMATTKGFAKKSISRTGGEQIAYVDLSGKSLSMVGSTVSFWAEPCATQWRDCVGIDYLTEADGTYWQVVETTKQPDASSVEIFSQKSEDGSKRLEPDLGDSDDSGVTPTAGTLNHWVIVTSGTSQSYYLNGSFLKTVDYGADLIKSTTNYSAFGFGGSASRGSLSGNAAVADVRIYNAALTEDQVSELYNEEPSAREGSATINTTFSDLTWTDGIAPTTGESAKVTLSNGVTLTLDTTLDLASLELVCDGNCTLANAEKLGSTVLNVSGVTGAVSYTIDASSANVTVSDALKGLIKTTSGTVTVTGGSGTPKTGVTLAYGNETVQFGPRMVFDSGKHTFKYGEGERTSPGNANGYYIFASGDSDDNPTILLQNGAEVDLYGKDLGGWHGTASADAVIRVNNGTKLNLYKHNGTFYYHNRFFLEEGAQIEIPENQELRLQGGMDEANAQIYVPSATLADDTVAEIKGAGSIFLATDGTAGIAVSVGANATLKMNVALSTANANQPIGKYGAGTLELTKTNSISAPVTVSAGTLKLVKETIESTTYDGTLGSGAVYIKEDATLEIEVAADVEAKTISNAIQGLTTTVEEVETTTYGTVKKTGAGELTLTEMNLASFDGDIVVEAGTLVLPLEIAQEETTTASAGATLKVVLDAIQMLQDQTVTKGDATIVFVDESGEELESEDGVYTAPMKTWTIEAGDLTDGAIDWASAIWDPSAPGDADAACIDVGANDVIVNVTAADTIASLKVVGSGTLTIAGTAALTTGIIEAQTNLIFSSATVKTSESTLPLVNIAAEKRVECTFASALNVPTLTGTGTFVKKGSSQAEMVASLECEPTIEVAEGKLLFAASQYSNAYSILVKSGAELQVGTWTGSLTSANNVIKLERGAKFYVNNGNNSSGSGVRAAYTVLNEGTSEDPARLYASLNGGNTNIQGTIELQGDLELADGASLSNAYTISAAISGSGKLIASDVNGGSGVTLSGTNTYTGGTEIAAGATLSVKSIAQLGGDGATVDVTGILKFTSTGNNADADTVNLSGITGTGTIWYSGSGHRTLPNTADVRFATSLTVKNDQAGGLIVTQNSGTTEIGSLEGSMPFRADWTTGNRILRIIQSKNTEHTGNLLTSSGRFSKIQVAGATAATEKTLTLSGTTTDVKLLEIESTGSVNLTGSWAGSASVAGVLAGTGTISGATTFVSGATLDASAATTEKCLEISGTVTLPESGTVSLTLPANVAAGTEVLKASGLDATKFAATLPEGMLLTATPTALAVVAKPSFEPAEGEEAMEDTTAQAIVDFAAAAGVPVGTTVTIAEGSDHPAGIECFTNVASANTSTGAVVITYNFGVERMTVVDGNLILLARVTSDLGADFKSTTDVTVTKGDETLSQADSHTYTIDTVWPDEYTDETGLKIVVIPLGNLNPTETADDETTTTGSTSHELKIQAIAQ